MTDKHERLLYRLRKGPVTRGSEGMHFQAYQELCNEAAAAIEELIAERNPAPGPAIPPSTPGYYDDDGNWFFLGHNHPAPLAPLPASIALGPDDDPPNMEIHGRDMLIVGLPPGKMLISESGTQVILTFQPEDPADGSPHEP